MGCGLWAAIFSLSSWVGRPRDWQPKAMITFHAVAVNTNLQKNEGADQPVNFTLPPLLDCY